MKNIVKALNSLFNSISCMFNSLFDFTSPKEYRKREQQYNYSEYKNINNPYDFYGLKNNINLNFMLDKLLLPSVGDFIFYYGDDSNHVVVIGQVVDIKIDRENNLRYPIVFDYLSCKKFICKGKLYKYSDMVFTILQNKNMQTIKGVKIKDSFDLKDILIKNNFFNILNGVAWYPK